MRSIVIFSVICIVSSAHHLDSKRFGKGFEDLLDQNKFEGILKGGKIDDLLGNLKNVGDGTKNSLKLASNLHKQLNSTEKKPLNEFFQFIIKHKKEYDNDTATSERFQNFRESKRRAEEHQKRDASATYGINKFSDLTKEEFIRQKTGIKGVEHVQRLHSTAKPSNHSRVKRDTIPSAFDWRDWGILSSIKDQGNCGCCYAFAAVGAVEANHKLYTGDDELDLSEQQMVSCTYHNANYGNNNGCNGGWSDKVMDYIRDKGITSEASYPYTSGSSGTIPSCKSKKPVIYISDEETLPAGDEDAMADYIYNYGPIVTYLDADQIMDYTGGVIDAPQPSEGWSINHAVVTVGYGTEGGKDFWVMKNQWGEDYGEAGYFRVRRGINSLAIADYNYNCQHLNGNQILALESLIDQIANAEERRETFRMFLIIYPEKGEAQHSLMGKCKVITLDDDYSLKGFLQYCYSTISPSWLHDQLDTPQRREMLYRLSCFHFCIVERCKYRIFGWITDFSVSTVNFESAANLFKDLCDRWAEISFNSLFSNVLEIAYLADMSDKYDLLVFRTIAQWIFSGLNKHDNGVVDNLHLKTYNVAPALVLEQIKRNKFPKDPAMSGLNEAVIRSCKRRNVLAIKKSILEMLKEDQEETFEADEDFSEARNEFVYTVGAAQAEEQVTGVEYCVRNEIRAIEEAGIASKRLAYLKTLLEQSDGIHRVEIRNFQRPQAILEQLKQDYAKRQRLPLDELIVFGTLRVPVSTDFVEFSGCCMLGAGYDKDYNCLQEARSPIQSIDTIYVLVKRKNLPVKAESFHVPLYYKQLNGGGFVHLLDIEVESNIPSNHWLLRGAKLCTASPIKLEAMEQENGGSNM